MNDDIRFNEICAARLGANTTSNYSRRIKKFKKFVEVETNTMYDINLVTAKHINTFISNESVWLSGSKKGHMKSVLTIESNHAAIVDHFKEEECQLPNNFQAVSRKNFKFKSYIM